MRRATGFAMIALLIVSCGGDSASAPAPPGDVSSAVVGEGADDGAEEIAAAPDHLPRPFTAEQIRDEMIEGFTAVLETTTGGGVVGQRWTVVGWTDDAVVIEYATLDPSGTPVGDSEVQSATWTELRDHATFDAATATRDRAERDTPLGPLAGWLYRVPTEEAETETETVSYFFFADDHPGAPVEFWTEVGGEATMTMIQTERDRPDD